MYDYLIVGCGLFGAVCARELSNVGRKVLIIEKRNHIGGNVYTENVNGVQVHKYGAHIFHTNDKAIWDYVNTFCEFNRFTNSPLATYQGKLFNLPFNMNTFFQLWGVSKPADAQRIIEEQRAELNGKRPENLEEQAISLVGRDVYELLIKGYTEKQWGRKCTELPAFIIRRLPVRFTFDNNYFSDKYQGIPEGGYTKMVEAMLQGVEVRLGVNYLKDKESLNAIADQVIYSGPIDAYFNYCNGALNYRSLRFESEELDMPNYQGNAVVNYTDGAIPFTRIIEHKHFDPVNTNRTVITKEYPSEWHLGDEPYYPVNDDVNNDLFRSYRVLANAEDGVIFGGRLAEYRYYDMHQVIASALKTVKEELSRAE